MLYTNGGQLRCWSVIEDKLVWQYQCDWRSSAANVDEFSVEVVDEGRAAVIAVAISAPAMPFLTCVCPPIFAGAVLTQSCSSKSVDVVRLDLGCRTSSSIVHHDLLGFFETDIPFSTQICGDFVIARVGNDCRDMLYLMRLSTQSLCPFTMEVRCLHFLHVTLIFWDSYVSCVTIKLTLSQDI